MVKFLSLFLVVLTSFALLVPEDADARRFGGGRSFGKQSTFSRQAAQPTRPATPSRQATSPQRSGKSRWLGPLAGLAAGGLLASLFFGGAFEGIQLFDILLIGLLVFGGWTLLRRMRAKQAPVHRYAAAGPAGFRTPDIGSGLPGGAGGAVPVQQPAPSWFDAPRFVVAAKKHFVGLQKAWDSGNMEEIRETVTPEMFAELTRERDSLGSGRQYTEVVTLNAEVLGHEYEGDNFLVSVRYSGLIKEDEHGQAQPFQEIWTIQRAVDDPKANWYVAGIQQV